MSNKTRRSAEERAADGEHLESLPDGCGCAEVWEHMSETRERVAGD